ncbi:hypothetical protein Tco_1525914 [Tanacetum coccineum]
MSGLKTCSVTFSLLDGSTDPEMVDPCASMVDPSRAVLADGPTKLIGLVPLVDALPLSNPKPILQLGSLTVDQLDTEYVINRIRRIGYGLYVFSCEGRAQIRRIFLLDMTY